MLYVWNLLFMARMALCRRVEAFRREERGAVDIVAIVVMIGIAVLLAVVFRKQIEGLLKSLFGSIEESALEAVEGG